MAVVSANRVNEYLETLDRYYAELRAAVAGKPLSDSESRTYSFDVENLDQLVHVNTDKVNDCIGHFKVSVDSLKRLKSYAWKPRRV